MALNLGFFKGGVDEDPDSDMVAAGAAAAAKEGKRWWRNELGDLERGYQNAQGHIEIVQVCAITRIDEEFVVVEGRPSDSKVSYSVEVVVCR
jgi:hypothetical protein